MNAARLRVPPRVSLLIFLASAGLAVVTLERAMTIDAAPSQVIRRSAKSAPMAAPAPSTSPASIAAAVKNDPFRAERRPPTERFRLPGEPLKTAVAQDSTKSPFQLIGTAVLTEGGGFAMCQSGDSAPRLVRVGERVAGMTLKSVAQGRAVFADAGGRRTELRVPKAGI